MKPFLISTFWSWFAALLSCVSATLHAQEPNTEQGHIFIGNYVPGVVDARWPNPYTFCADGWKNSQWQAQLWVVNDEGEDFPVGTPIPFLDDELAGYLDPSQNATVTIPDVQPGERVNVYLKTWDTLNPELEDASNIIEVEIPSEGQPSANLAGLQPGLLDIRSDLQFGHLGSVLADFITRFRIENLSDLTRFGDDPDSIQWYSKSPGGNWQPIPEENFDDLIVRDIDANTPDRYRALVAWDGCTQFTFPGFIFLEQDDVIKFERDEISGKVFFAMPSLGPDTYYLERSMDLETWEQVDSRQIQSEEIVTLNAELMGSENFFQIRRVAEIQSFTVAVPIGYSTISNPLERENNTVSELLTPYLPNGSVLFKWDIARQEYYANQLLFGEWNDPDQTLDHGEGAFLLSPLDTEIEFTGIWPMWDLPEIYNGANLISFHPQITEVQELDNAFEVPNGTWVLPFNGINFDSSIYVFGSWSDPELPLNVGEAYFALFGGSFNDAPPSGELTGKHIFVSNFAGPVDVPFTDEDGNPLDSDWRAQLWVDSGNGLSPVGIPLPFLDGAGQGYIDTTEGAVVTVPDIDEDGETVNAVLRVWDSTTGPGWDSATVRGESEVLEIEIFNSSFGPPSPPALLEDLPTISLVPL